MKLKLITLSYCLATLAVSVSAQAGTSNDGGTKPWFWNSTTSSAESLTADAAVKNHSTTATPATDSEIQALVSATKDNTTEKNIFSPALFDGFLPSNVTSGRSAVVDLFADDFAPANVTRGRSNKALNLDLIGNFREGRIINDDPGNRKLSLQGFIPIVSFSGKEADDEDTKRSAKSPKRDDGEDLYYNGNYGPVPIDDEEQTKSQNFYSPAEEPPRNSRFGFEKSVDNPKQNGYGQRIQDVKHANSDFYIPPARQNSAHPQQNSAYQQQNSASQQKDRYIIVPEKEAVRYLSADEYHKRPVYVDSHNQGHDSQRQGYDFQRQGHDSPKAESQSSGHFVVSSKPSRDEENNVQYAQAGPYPPQPIPQNELHPAKDTFPKQAFGAKQFDPEGLYELQNTNYILNQNNEEEKCICVPFYLCRHGYLVNGRSLEKDDDIDERSARKIEKDDDIDERSARKIEKRSVGNETKDSTTLAPYTEDIMARMIGLGGATDSCGLLRRCCKVPQRRAPPGGLLPFSPDNYPIPQPDLSGLPPGLLPPGISLQPVPGSPGQAFIVNQGGYPGPQEQQIILVPQEQPHGPHQQQPHRRPRPIQPPHQGRPHHPSGPVHRPNQNRPIRPNLPQRRPQPPQPVYQPQPNYPKPQPVYQPEHSYPKPQPAYQPEHSYPKPQQVFPPQNVRPPRRQYQPDYNDHPAQIQQGQCGARNGYGIHGRVNNLQYQDDASEFGEYPWQAAILLKVGPGNNLFVCGGTLITNNWVATAAHCLKKHQADELKVRLGDWDVHRDDEFYPYVEKYVVEVVVHPDFYPGNLQNDLALLRLESPVDSSSPHISPACLPELNERFDNLRCWVTGWGKNAFGEQGEYQSVLKEVDVPMLSQRDCEFRLKQTRLGRSYNLHPGFLCAGGEPGKDACTGDGGSPLVCEQGGTWKVAGLVSWGIGCGQAGVPGIYVNMAKYRSWIDTVIGRYG